METIKFWFAEQTLLGKIATIIGISAILGVIILAISGTSDTDTDAWICAQDLVKQELKYDASSAKFGSKSSATITDLGDNKYMVEGTVKAKNAFGTYVEKNFVATFTLTESGYKNGYVTFD